MSGCKHFIYTYNREGLVKNAFSKTIIIIANYLLSPFSGLLSLLFLFTEAVIELTAEPREEESNGIDLAWARRAPLDGVGDESEFHPKLLLSADDKSPTDRFGPG